MVDKFSKDQEVLDTYSGKIGKLTGEKKPYGPSSKWQVKFGDGEALFIPENDLEVQAANEDPESRLNKGQFGNKSELQRYLSSIRLNGKLTNIFYSMHIGATTFYPHQYKPVLKFVESTSNRLLIADEVGLGKTIEALYIWKELVARQNASKLLIISPAGLRSKWYDDALKFFGISSDIVNAKQLLSKIKESLASPRIEQRIWIISLDGIRCNLGDDIDEYSSDSRTALNSIFAQWGLQSNQNIFDLVIIDEAHKLRNSLTASYETAERVGEITNGLVLLSATPIQTKSENLYNLLRLLAPEEYYDHESFEHSLEAQTPLIKIISDIRNNVSANLIEQKLGAFDAPELQRYAGLASVIQESLPILNSDANARIHLINTLTPSLFYDQYFSRSIKREVFPDTAIRSAATESFSFSEREKQIYDNITEYLQNQRRGQSMASVFRTIMRQKQMTSSLPAAIRHWKQYLSLPENLWENSGDVEDLEVLEEKTDTSVSDVTAIIGKTNLSELEKNDSKYKKLKIILDSIDKSEKVIIFSFFRYTVTYLEERLRRDSINTVTLLGGLSREDRDTRLKNFRNDPTIRVMVSSETGAEGIDLQFAGIEVNYDLPWNPMLLEQRIGRIDRIGQQRKKIAIYNLSCADTIEDKVLQRLYDRIEIFKNSIGNIEEILGETMTQLELAVFSPDLTPEQREEQIEQNLTAIAQGKYAVEQLGEHISALNPEFQDVILKNITVSDQNKRYVGHEELLSLVHSFFAQYYQGTEIKDGKKGSPSIVLIKLSLKALAAFKAFNQKPFKSTRFGEADKFVLCNFDSTLESTLRKKIDSSTYGLEEYQTVPHEFIEPNHPLMRWIASEIEKTSYNLNGCAALYFPQTSDTPLKSGIYVYYIEEWIDSGYRNGDEFHFLLGNVTTQEVITPEMSEKVFMNHIFTCEELQNKLGIYEQKRDKIAAMSSLLSSQMSDLSYAHAEEFKAAHSASIAQRKEYAKMVADRKRDRVLQTISEMEAHNRQPRMINLQRSRLKKVDTDYEMMLNEIAQKEKAQSQTKVIAVGLVYIGEENNGGK